MKNKLVLTFTLFILFAIFTSCEAEPTLPEIYATVKGYNDEIFEMMASALDNTEPTDFAQGDSFQVDQGVTCIVTASDADEINLSMTLENWLAADGTAISGYLILDVEYFTSPQVSLTIIRTGGPASLYFNRSSVSYMASCIDTDNSSTAFTTDYEYFYCNSLIIDGEILIFNPYY